MNGVQKMTNKSGSEIIIKCPMCNSSNIRKSGFVLKRSGKKQKYQCKEDAHTFIID